MLGNDGRGRWDGAAVLCEEVVPRGPRPHVVVDAHEQVLFAVAGSSQLVQTLLHVGDRIVDATPSRMESGSDSARPPRPMAAVVNTVPGDCVLNGRISKRRFSM